MFSEFGSVIGDVTNSTKFQVPLAGEKRAEKNLAPLHMFIAVSIRYAEP